MGIVIRDALSLHRFVNYLINYSIHRRHHQSISPCSARGQGHDAGDLVPLLRALHLDDDEPGSPPERVGEGSARHDDGGERGRHEDVTAEAGLRREHGAGGGGCKGGRCVEGERVGLVRHPLLDRPVLAGAEREELVILARGLRAAGHPVYNSGEASAALFRVDEGR